MDTVLKIIQEENKKNPLTDEKIASILKINREDVTEYRCLKKIPDSRERRRPYLFNDIKGILSKNPNMSDRKLTNTLNDIGYDISRFSVSQIKKEIFNSGEDVEEDVEENVEENIKPDENVNNNEEPLESKLTPFKEIIGYDGSLKMQISQARAAILYPPQGLHTLILGPSGVGKSQLAEAMYEFAMESGILKKESKFVVFNCADYADNPQLLMGQLFGYSKGSFTGAYESKPGLIEKADGGILFLDEVHRLPSEGQEILFYLLDKGKFRKLGETENTRTAQIRLITATTENPESSLLVTFRRRIPMVIELPSINERPLLERYRIINYFFAEEAFRINRPIKIKSDVIRALMLYDCPGNIGQIRSDIQVICARGFLNTIDSKSENMDINLSYLPNHVKLGLLKVNKRDPNIQKYTDKDVVVYQNKKSKLLSKKDRYMLQNDIYQFIEERFNELKNQGLSKEDIYKIVGNQIETELNKFASCVKSDIMVSKKELKEIVGSKIIYVVENAIGIANSNYKHIRENFFYSFAIHLSAAYDRFKSGKTIVNPQIQSVKEKYPNDYMIAKKIVDMINSELKIKLADDEVGFVAMYLRAFSTNENKNQRRVAIIVLTHGHVAKGIADVANRLIGVNLVHGIEMDLDEKPEGALLRTIETVKEVDQGKGCLILIDMGSLITFGEIITKRTGIQTRTVGRVDTVMVLEAVRRALIPDVTIDDIVNGLDVGKTYVGHIQGTKDSYGLPKAIVTICITGEGTALKMKRYIEDKIDNICNKLKIIPIGIFNKDEINKQIVNISRENNIVAFVGSIDPKFGGIPFISVEKIMNGEGLKALKEIIDMGTETKSKLEEVITEGLILNNPDVNNKNDLIDKMVDLLEHKGYVDKNFILSIYKRESINPTWIEGCIAIPHGSSQYVIKPSIVIAKLKKAIDWQADFKADLIFLIALKTNSKDYMYSLYKLLKNKSILNALRKAQNPDEIKKIILENTISTD